MITTDFVWLPDAALRGAALLTVTLVVARLLRSQPAALRHVLWTGAIAGVMTMPLLSMVAPVRVTVDIPWQIALPEGASPEPHVAARARTAEHVLTEDDPSGSNSRETTQQLLPAPEQDTLTL